MRSNLLTLLNNNLRPLYGVFFFLIISCVENNIFYNSIKNLTPEEKKTIKISGTTTDDLDIYISSKDGHREKIDSEGNNFSFDIDTSKFIEISQYMDTEIIAAMGNVLKKQISTQLDGSGVIKYLPIEFIPKEIASEPFIDYYQHNLEYTRKDIFENEIKLDNFNLIKTGNLIVELFDQNDIPIENGLVMAIFSNKISFKPLFYKTNKLGKTNIPIYIDQDKSKIFKYQVFATADKYCTYLGSQTEFDQINNGIKIILPKCDKAADDVFDLKVQIDGFNTETKQDNGENKFFYLIGKDIDDINIKLFSKNNNLRPIKIDVFDSTNASGNPVIFYNKNIFSTDIKNIYIPPNRGRYVIRVFPRKSEGLKVNTVLIYIDRFDIKPEFKPKMYKNLSLLNSVGKRLVFKNPDIGEDKIIIQSEEYCKTNYFIGLKIEDEQRFAKCTDNKAEFKVSDFDIVYEYLDINQVFNVSLVLKDPWGNMSEEITKNDQDEKMKILVEKEVDFYPLTLGDEVFIIPKEDKNIEDPSTLGQIILEPGKDYVFKFKEKDSCFSSSYYGFYAIEKTQEAVENTDDYTSCFDYDKNNNPVMISKEIDIDFPQNQEDNIIFYMSVKGISGVKSKDFNTIQIKNCDLNPDEDICWENN